jgi:hypothetical protein
MRAYVFHQVVPTFTLCFRVVYHYEPLQIFHVLQSLPLDLEELKILTPVKMSKIRKYNINSTSHFRDFNDEIHIDTWLQ